jgi:hypothetical protein
MPISVSPAGGDEAPNRVGDGGLAGEELWTATAHLDLNRPPGLSLNEFDPVDASPDLGVVDEDEVVHPHDPVAPPYHVLGGLDRRREGGSATIEG